MRSLKVCTGIRESAFQWLCEIRQVLKELGQKGLKRLVKKKILDRTSFVLSSNFCQKVEKVPPVTNGLSRGHFQKNRLGDTK